MDALVKAAEAEGTLNVIAVPPEWANYEGVLDDVQGQVPEITVDEQGLGLQQPAGDRRGQQPAGHGQGARRPRPRAQRSRSPTPPSSRRTRSRPGPTSRTTSRRPRGLWVSDYAGFMSIGCDTKKVAAPATVADLLKPEYKGMVALNGNPKSAAAGLHGVVMAALANGGSADDISAGVTFFNELNDGRQPAAGRPDAGDDRVRADAVRHRLGVQQRGPDGGPARARASTGRSSSRPTLRRSRRTTTRPSTRTRRTRRRHDCGRSSSTRPRPRTSG